MLRNRSRSVSSKQALMADHGSQPSATRNYNKHPPSFFGSPKFRAFTTKPFSETDGLISPTSVLDTKPFYPFPQNPFSNNKNQSSSHSVFSGNKRSWETSEAKGIGLVLIDTLYDEPRTGESFPSSCNQKLLLLGTKLRVQIPPFPSTSIPPSPADFGIKTRNSNISANGVSNSCNQTKDSPKLVPNWITVSDLEQSEDYTCVISRGPNPKTTHIFDNCIVESHFCLSNNLCNSYPQNFLSFCHTCKKNLEQKNDIYIYRGEKAFCSEECRYQEMILDGDFRE
ncbi:hypothetical protein UlMin_031449 [Ulmus minor]